MAIVLNVDAGELADEPDALYAAAHAVSIACGGHAGDASSMRRVLGACARAGTRAGAHPSYADREGFGRRALDVPPAELEAQVTAQCAALAAIARDEGVPVAHVKPHGALYHAANRDRAFADAVVGGAKRALGRVIVVGPPEGALRAAAEAHGMRFEREGFADRAMRADGSLVPRGEAGAVLHDVAQVVGQARALAASGRFETLCIHGDTEGAVRLVRAVREALEALEM